MRLVKNQADLFCEMINKLGSHTSPTFPLYHASIIPALTYGQLLSTVEAMINALTTKFECPCYTNITQSISLISASSILSQLFL